MKKLSVTLSFLLMVFFFASCNDEAITTDNNLATTWLLYEQGYSPGGEYITNAVPNDPPQTMIFYSDSTFASNIAGLSELKFYRMKGNVISLYKTDPSVPATDPTQLIQNYSFRSDGSDLKLYYQFCIEGCHMAFRRLEFCNLL